jgi:leader peptidase (prepilin peptidase)/N-methyltransferase
MLLLALLINGAFGGGDIKLMAVCGFLLGWQNTLVAFFAALLIMTAVGGYMVIKGKYKKNQPVAFGPALCAGVFLSVLYGYSVTDWYRSLLMF